MNWQRIRKWHSTLAPLVLLPLLITVITGMSYRLAKSWFGLSRDQVHWLMTLHEGEYLGPTLEPVYVLFNGLGLVWMLGTGATLVVQKLLREPWVRRWIAPPSPPVSSTPGPSLAGLARVEGSATEVPLRSSLAQPGPEGLSDSESFDADSVES